MVAYGGLWRPVGAYRDPWIPKGPCGGLLGPVGTHGDLWGPLGPLGTDGDLGERVGANGHLRGPMGTFLSLWAL